MNSSIKQIFFSTIFLFLLAYSSITFAQEAATPVVAEAQGSLTKEVIPSVSIDINDAIDDFHNNKVDQADALIETLDSADATQALVLQYKNLQNRYDNYQQGFNLRKTLSSWDLNKAIDSRDESKELFGILSQIKSEYTKNLKTADELLTDLKNQKLVFKKTYLDLNKDAVVADKEALQNAIDQIENLVADLKAARVKYSRVYYDYSDLRQEIYDFQKALDEEVNHFNEARFQKTTAAVYDPDFFHSFDANVWTEFKITLKTILNLDLIKLQAQWLHYFQLIVFFLALNLVVIKLLSVVAQKKESQDLSKVPANYYFIAFVFALGIDLILASLIIEQPPVVMISIFWFLTAFVFIAVAKILGTSSSNLKRAVFWVALYAALQIINAVGVPLLLYRLILMSVSFGGMVYCSLRLRALRKQHPKRNYFRELTLQLSALIYLVVIISSVLGYHLLSDMLFQGFTQTMFLLVVMWYAKILLLQITAKLLEGNMWQRFKWLRRTQVVIRKKVGLFIYLVLTSFTFVALISIWANLSILDALRTFLDFKLGFQEHSISLRMILQAVLSFYLVSMIASLICGFLEDEVYDRKHITFGTGQSFNRLITYLGWFIGGVLVFDALGFKLEQFALIAGALSVGIGFGLQNIINNFVSGLILLFERPVKVGDILDIEGQLGTVEKVGLRSTTIRGGSKAQLIIPNSHFVTQTVSNLTLSDSDYRMSLPISVAYGTDTQLLKQALLDICLNHPKINKDQESKVLFKGFGESSLNFELVACISYVGDQADMMSDLLFAIDKKFRELKIEIPYPQRDIHIK